MPMIFNPSLQLSTSLPGLQVTADLVSVCAMVSNLTIAVNKLRVFHYCGLSASPDEPEVLLIHTSGWIPLEA